MTRPAIFFDRDNTLIACDDYLGDPEKVELIDGAADAIARRDRLALRSSSSAINPAWRAGCSPKTMCER